MVGTLRFAHPTRPISARGSRSSAERASANYERALRDRAREAAEARRTCLRFERRIALLFGEGEACLGVAALGCFIADQKRDRCPLVARSPAGLQRVLDQGLHQPAPAIFRQ